MELRQRLGLGVGPITDIVTLLEMELGVRVYVRRLDGRYFRACTPTTMRSAPACCSTPIIPATAATQTRGTRDGTFISTRREPEDPA